MEKVFPSLIQKKKIKSPDPPIGKQSHPLKKIKPTNQQSKPKQGSRRGLKVASSSLASRTGGPRHGEPEHHWDLTQLLGQVHGPQPRSGFAAPTCHVSPLLLPPNLYFYNTRFNTALRPLCLPSIEGFEVLKILRNTEGEHHAAPVHHGVPSIPAVGRLYVPPERGRRSPKRRNELQKAEVSETHREPPARDGLASPPCRQKVLSSASSSAGEGQCSLPHPRIAHLAVVGSERRLPVHAEAVDAGVLGVAPVAQHAQLHQLEGAHVVTLGDRRDVSQNHGMVGSEGISGSGRAPRVMPRWVLEISMEKICGNGQARWPPNERLKVDISPCPTSQAEGSEDRGTPRPPRIQHHHPTSFPWRALHNHHCASP